MPSCTAAPRTTSLPWDINSLILSHLRGTAHVETETSHSDRRKAIGLKITPDLAHLSDFSAVPAFYTLKTDLGTFIRQKNGRGLCTSAKLNDVIGLSFLRFVRSALSATVNPQVVYKVTSRIRSSVPLLYR